MHSQTDLRDPRTIARENPGFLDGIFPRLAGGLVRYLNEQAYSFDGIQDVDNQLIKGSGVCASLLFEISLGL